MKAFRYTFFLIQIVAASSLALSAQDPSIINVITTPTTCSDGTDGHISFTIEGGLAPFQWFIYEGGGFPVDFGITSGTSVTTKGLGKYGMYLIAVKDSLDRAAYMTASIDGPEAMLITSFTHIDLSCNNSNDGSIDVTASGESGSHIFDLAGPVSQSDPSGSFSGLPSGIYTVTARDAGSCTTIDVTPPIEIVNPSLVSATAIITNAGCFGEFSGAVNIAPAGGTPSGTGSGYSYAWTGPNGFNHSDEDILNLEAGDYFVTITDGNGCFSLLGPYTVGQPTEITVVLDGSVDVRCNGENNGTASISTAGGAGGYIYTWTGLNSGLIVNDEDPTTLVADTYSLIIEDGSGCSVTFNPFITINEPDTLGLVLDSTNPVNCNGQSDGSAEVTASGGSSPYSFSWTGPGYTSTEEDPTAMPAGIYSVSLTDNHSCTKVHIDFLTITEPLPVSINVDVSTDISCFGADDGAVQITTSGGTEPYSYTWIRASGGGYTSNIEDPTDMPPGSYHLFIIDGNGCPFFFMDAVSIAEPAELDLTVNLITNVNCNGESSGAIDISPLGGTPPYGFAWTGPNGFTADTEDILGLSAGDYSLTLTDSHGCSRDFPDHVSILENPAIVVSAAITDVNCGMPNISSDGAIDITVSGGIPGYTFSWTGPNGFTADIEDISGLEPGQYSLTVTDLLFCTFQSEYLVGVPDPLTVTTTSVDIDCFGAGNGSIDLTVAGGTAPYVFAWSGPSGYTGSSEDISGLEAGVYSVTVTDDHGCPVLFAGIDTITEPAEILDNPVKTDISCGGLTDGAIDITPTGGTLPYLFAWSGPDGFTATSEDLTGLAAGSYNLTITDGNTCVVSFPAVIILEPASVVATYVSQVDVLCNGDASGSIEIDVSGGVIPYIFNWTNSSGVTASDIEDPVNLPAETYSLQITDANGCEFSFANLAEITEPPLLIADLIKTDISCFSAADGTITTNASGGFGSYEYSIDGTSFQAGNSFGPLVPGFYTIWTRDDNMCEVTDTITILEPEEILIAEEIARYLCHGDLQGEISINDVSGGVPPYQYSINGGADFYSTNVFPNLAPGAYQTVVMDANGCSVNGMLNVLTEPLEIQIASYVQTNISSCYDAAEGSISIIGTGGTGDFTYSLNGAPPADTGYFQNLLGGSYILTLIDANACTHDTTVEIMAPPQLIISNITVTDVTGCSGDSNGSLEITVAGGTGVPEYSLDDVNYQAGNIFTDLIAGEYIVWVRDINLCTSTDTVNIYEPAPVLADIEKTDAIYGSLGTITISNARGGTAPYTYSINDTTGPFSSTTVYIDLLPANYHVIVRDLAGCEFDSIVEILDTPPLNVLVNVTNVSCFGANDGSIEFVPQDAQGPVTFSIDSGFSFHPEALFDSLTGGIYHLIAQDTAGKIFTSTDTIIEPTEILFSYRSTPAKCNAFSETGSIEITVSGGTGSYSYLWSDGDTAKDRNNVLAGIYNLLLTDSNNCSLEEKIFVGSEVTVEANAGEDTTICFGDAIQLQGSTHGSPTWDPSDLLEDHEISNPMTVALTEPTTFVLTITESIIINGCYNVDSITVDLHPPAEMYLTPDTFVIKGHSAQLEVRGGPFELYRWEPEAGLDNVTAPDPIATPLESTLYYVYATNEFGCEQLDSVYIDVLEDIEAYNAFSPNGDGINERFEIKNAGRFPEMLVEVYSRWGDLLFSTVGYDSDNQWDGTARGKDVPVGTYYYIIVPYEGAKVISGNVTIIR